jgi:transcriptional regulator with XRE-family HTH domain
MLDTERRKQLREFLIERRARLKPNDVGLAQRGLRRCPGLRREEVAELAGVSANWYTMFEMARRNRRVSMRMIARVSTALRLDEADRAMLLRLAVPEICEAAQIYEQQAIQATLNQLAS